MKRLNFIILLLILCFAVSISAQMNQPKIQSKFAEFSGAKVHYYDTGKGKNALVFIHGWTCSADFWSRSLNAFPEYRVIAIDLIGHGRSDKPRTNYNMDYFAKSVEAVLRDAKVKKAVLAGHSMGTPVARQFYRLYPEKTAAIIVVDGPLRALGTKPQMEAFFAPLRANYKETLKRYVGGMIQTIKDEKLKDEILSGMLATPDYVGISAIESFAEDKIWEKDQIKIPVLAMMIDPGWKPDEQDYFKSIIPNLDYRVWQGYSHFLMMEQPAVFNKTVKLFIAKNKLL